MRVAKQRPSGDVVLSLVGPLRTGGLVMWVGEHQNVASLEYRMCVGLNVQIATALRVPFPRVIEAINAMAPHCEGLSLWWQDAPNVVFPVKWGGTVPEMHICSAQYIGVPEERERLFAQKVNERLRKEYPVVRRAA
jgi:hypothetical protein